MENLFNRLWLYNNWANQSLFKLFEQYGPQLPANCLHLLSHIVNTQLVWLSRLNGEAAALKPWDDHSLEECRLLHEQSAAQLKQEIENISVQPDQKLRYTNTQGITFENSSSDILLHVFNHATYHRAQIAQELRRNGLEPINTDYISFVR